MTDQTSRAKAKAQSSVGTATQPLPSEAISKALREQYEAVLAEPVPESLLALLDALEKRELES